MDRPDKKGNIIVEKVPEKILKIMNELITQKNQFINKFISESFQLGELQDKVNKTRNQLKTKKEQIGQKIQYAFGKLKLGKKKNYNWTYDGKGNFIGREKPIGK